MKQKRKIGKGPQFLNVDLDIESRHDLNVLKAELGRKVFDLGEGPVTPGYFLLRLETSRQFGNPDDTICAFCSLLEKLSTKGNRAWRSAHKKEFDIGFDADRTQIASQFSLRSATLGRISDLGATLGVTFYFHPQNAIRSPAKPFPPKPRRE